MSPTPSKETIQSLEDLKSFVYTTICLDNQLLPGDHPTSENFLRRGNSDTICGMFFYLQGPRAVRLSAVWDREGNRVLLYGQNGRRYKELKLEAEIAIEGYDK